MSNFVYRKDHIPKGTGHNRRPALFMNPTTITIHNTGNPKSSAINERTWLTNATNTRQASFHIVVDMSEAIECIPLNENAWHAGDGNGIGSGNRTSIGIELCESGNYEKTLENAVKLVAGMLKERGWGVDRLRRHWDWSGKVCPRLMHDGGKWTGWDDFKRRVQKELNGGEEKLELSNYQWQSLRNGVSALIDSGKINDKTWLDKIDKRTLTVSELAWLSFIVNNR